MQNCFLILLLTFAKYSTAQNEVIYNNLAEELYRQLNYSIKKGWYYNFENNVSNTLKTTLSDNKAFMQSLQKMNTINISNPKLELRSKTLELFFSKLQTDTFTMSDSKKIHFAKVNAYLCGCLEKTSYAALPDSVQIGIYERCLDRFYKDIANNKELQSIIKNELAFNKSIYNFYDNRYYYWTLYKECNYLRAILIKEILSYLKSY